MRFRYACGAAWLAVMVGVGCSSSGEFQKDAVLDSEAGGEAVVVEEAEAVEETVGGEGAPVIAQGLPESVAAGLVYEEATFHATMHRENMFHEWGKKMDGEIEIVPITGADAAALLSQNGMDEPLDPKTNAYLETLLAHPDSKAFAYEFPPGKGTPTGAVYIPFPSGIQLSPPPPLKHGATLLFGMGDTSSPDAPAPAPKASSLHAVKLTPERWASKIQKKQSFLAVVHAPGCGTSDYVEAHLRALVESDASLDIVSDEMGGVLSKELGVLMSSVIYPTLVYVENGVLADFYIAANVRPVEHSLRSFLVRHGMLKGEANTVVPERPVGADDETWVRRVGILNHWPSANFDGMNLAGVSLAGGSVSGSSFRGTNLEGADFRGALVTKVDFRGAKTKGLLAKGAYFYDVICPDGTRTGKTHKVCQGFGL